MLAWFFIAEGGRDIVWTLMGMSQERDEEEFIEWKKKGIPT